MGQDLREPVDVLLVEDNPGDVRLTEEAFAEVGLRTDLHAVTRGREALDYLHNRDDYAGVSRPDLVLLDLNLPGLNGTAVLEEIKTTQGLKTIPVLVLTSSEAEEDVVEGYAKHANAYLTKPTDVSEFIELVRAISEFWGRKARLPS